MLVRQPGAVAHPAPPRCTAPNGTVSVPLCLEYLHCLSQPAPAMLLATVFDKTYEKIVLEHWLVRAHSLGYTSAAAFTILKDTIVRVVGGAHGEHECTADFAESGPQYSWLAPTHVGFFKFLVMWHALALAQARGKRRGAASGGSGTPRPSGFERGGVIFSEADVVLLRDPMEEPLGALSRAGDFEGDMLISSHAYNPMVNIGFMIFFASEASLYAAERFVGVFYDVDQSLRRADKNMRAFDQLVFDAQLGNSWRINDARTRDPSIPMTPNYASSVPQLKAEGRELHWETLPPSQYVEFSGSPLCWPLRSEGCWGGAVEAAVTAHFTCLPTSMKLSNIEQLYVNKTCHFCAICWGNETEHKY